MRLNEPLKNISVYPSFQTSHLGIALSHLGGFVNNIRSTTRAFNRQQRKLL
jgi:hypothetical protein